MTEDDKAFCRDVDYFWTEKGDPTRYVRWDEERCKRLMPEFHEAWRKARIYERLAHASLKGMRHFYEEQA